MTLFLGRQQQNMTTTWQETFKRLNEKGLTLNPDKRVFDKHHLDFLGYTFGPAARNVT